jgi:4-hydroxy-tetrahydrodipicolinate reductase
MRSPHSNAPHVVIGTSGLTDDDFAAIDAVARHAPSGTAGELATLAKVREPEPTIPVDRTVGSREARGATLSGTQVHSIRLPGYVTSAEVAFGMADQRLTIRHDAGSSARPYVDGALLAIRRAGTLVGVHRGLGAVLDV